MDYEVTRLRYSEETKEVDRLMKEVPTPVYYIHVRKTAGTAINYAFLQSSQAPDTGAFFEDLAQKPNHRLIRNDKVFVGWNVRLINEGKYSYAFSHAPCHRLKLPSHVFSFTCLRDPAERVISHYNYLRNFQVNNIHHPCMKREGPWLGNSLDDFIANMPTEYFKNQLYTFSSDLNVNEAFDRVMQCDYFFFTREIDDAVKVLEKKLNWTLPLSRENKTGYREPISQTSLDRLYEQLKDEYELVNRLNQARKPISK